jgi:hypothetical protein
MTAITSAAGPQHLRALARANEVRLARAEIKRRIADGETTPAEVVLRPPWEVGTMPVSELLMSQRFWGLTRCRRLLRTIPLVENKSIGTMTDRQRHALAAALGRSQGSRSDY